MLSSLFLVPTEFESQFLSADLVDAIQDANSELSLCGFGPIVSGIKTTALIAQHQPERVFLLGVAGALVRRLIVGEVVEFDTAVCFGIGAGTGSDFLTAAEMGWRQWPGVPEITDSISIQSNDPQERVLLTCCSASANDREVQSRMEKYPKAIAEDMEGFSVAAACRLAGTPLRIVRGISNQAGDRNKGNWRVKEAMSNIELFVRKVLAS